MANIGTFKKSGTNEFHGTVYDFYRNEKMDANDFFSKRAGRSKPANDQNQFGANLGGPIIKDKLFFFANYEELASSRAAPDWGPIGSGKSNVGITQSADTEPAVDSPHGALAIERARG